MNKLRSLLPILFALVLLSISIWVIDQQLKEYSLADVVKNFAAIPKNKKLGAIALTFLGYLIMSGYDLLGFRYIRQSLALGKIVLTSFISYAVGNTVGFTIFSGSAIRYRFYSAWGISAIDITKIIFFTHLTFWLGLLAVGGVVFLIDPLTIPKVLHLPFKSVHPLGIIFLLLVVIYFISSFFWRKPIKIAQEEFSFPNAGISLALIAVSALDWALAASVLYLLFPQGNPLSYPSFFGIYILALIAGMISTVPGGLGVFETVILFLHPPSIPTPEVLGALIAYRGVYYFLPLIVAAILLFYHEFFRRKINN